MLEEPQGAVGQVGGNTVDDAELREEQRGRAVMVRDPFQRRRRPVVLAEARGEPVGEDGVAASPFRLGQGAVGDVADHLG